jgi:hypothetical protein
MPTLAAPNWFQKIKQKLFQTLSTSIQLGISHSPNITPVLCFVNT